MALRMSLFCAMLLSAPLALAHEGEHFHLHPHGVEGIAVAAAMLIAAAVAYREGWLPKFVYRVIGRDRDIHR